jgi:sodium transport system ATP-binding protein
MRDRGVCVIFSSHVLEEVEALCDHVVIVSHGRVVASGDVPAICRQTQCSRLEEAFLALTGHLDVEAVS